MLGDLAPVVIAVAGEETLAVPTMGRAASDWGIPHSRQGDSRDGVVGAAGQATGSSPQPGVNAHPSGRVLVLLPPKAAPFAPFAPFVPQRGLSKSLERCPSDKPCSELVSRRAPHAAPASVCPSLSTLSIHPHQPVWNSVSPVAASTPPGARSLAPPSISP